MKKIFALCAITAWLGIFLNLSGQTQPRVPGLNIPVGSVLSKRDLNDLTSLFKDQPLLGGQVAPRIYKWVNENVALFLQFDGPNPQTASTLEYAGIIVKGVFCAEAQPDKAFSHFHRLTAASYNAGHGGKPGEPGYWMTWMATPGLDSPTRLPGVSYGLFATPPPSCGTSVPKPDLKSPGFTKLSKEEIQKLNALLSDRLFLGGQVAPRIYKWVNEKMALFLEFDKSTVSEATALRYMGLSVRNEFCKEQQIHSDFSHFHRLSAPQFSEGHSGSKPGELGYWHLFMSLDEFEMPWGKVLPGVDRKYAPTPAPACLSAGIPDSREIFLVIQQDKSEEPLVFAPKKITIRAGTKVRWINAAEVYHTVTSTDSLQEPNPNGSYEHVFFKKGDVFEYIFTKPGTYYYYCQPHASFMFGTITVIN